MKLIDSIQGIQKYLARLIRFDGKFHRFTGALSIEHYEGDNVVESEQGEAIWELMYFGHIPKGATHDRVG